MVEVIGDNQKTSTVLSEWHDNFLSQEDKYKIFQINDGYYWMQIIHSSNVSNNVVGWPSLRVQAVSDFGIAPSSITFKKVDYAKSLARRFWQSFGKRLNR